MGDPILEEKDYYAMHITDQGLALLTKVMAREIALKFTRVASGDGYLPEGADPYKITALVNPVRDLPITSKEDGGGVVVIRCYQTSTGLAEPYDSREIGLFADDPDDGEILYAYHNAGDHPDFIPSQGSPVQVDWILALVTLVKRAANIEVSIDANFAFVSQPELDHRFDDLFGPTAPISEFWTRTSGDGRKLRPSGRNEIMDFLGLQDYSGISRRVDVLEDNEAEIYFALEMLNTYPEITHRILENFVEPDQIDIYSCSVIHVVAGSSAIDCDRIQGLVPGCVYTLTDGKNRELVQVKSVNVENNLNRVITASPVQNTYLGQKTYLYRTSAVVTAEGAEGVSPPRLAAWSPEVTWQGVTGNTVFDVALDTSLAAESSFDVEGDISWIEGEVTLEVVS